MYLYVPQLITHSTISVKTVFLPVKIVRTLELTVLRVLTDTTYLMLLVCWAVQQVLTLLMEHVWLVYRPV